MSSLDESEPFSVSLGHLCVCLSCAVEPPRTPGMAQRKLGPPCLREPERAIPHPISGPPQLRGSLRRVLTDQSIPMPYRGRRGATATNHSVDERPRPLHRPLWAPATLRYAPTGARHAAPRRPRQTPRYRAPKPPNTTPPSRCQPWAAYSALKRIGLKCRCCWTRVPREPPAGRAATKALTAPAPHQPVPAISAATRRARIIFVRIA